MTNTIVKKMGKELNLEQAYCHMFRRTLATTMSKKGKVPVQVIQAYLGHSDVKTTINHYLSIERDQLKDAIESI